MSNYSEEYEDYSSEEFEISDGENDSEMEELGREENEILETCVGNKTSCSTEDENKHQHKLTDVIKRQQELIESLQTQVASLKMQISKHAVVTNRKCAPKSEESTSAVVSSFEDDDDELDSLSSEESCHSYGLPEIGALAAHPLLIDVVIQKVMEHLPLKSLLVVRLVCRKWNGMAAYQIASKSGPVLLEVHQPWMPSKGIKVSTFIDVMKNSLCCPFSKFSISSFVALEELDRFIFHFGRNIRHLDLNFHEGFDDSEAFITLLTRKIPHLESLRIGCCQMFKEMYVTTQSNSAQPDSCSKTNKVILRSLKTVCIGNVINMAPSRLWLEAFFKMTPNLEKLVLHVNFKENGNTFIRMVLEALLNLEVSKNIRSLVISCLTESHLRTLIKLAECGLRLKHFRFQDICLHLTEINGATLETFLFSQAEHLESLEIDQSSNFPRIRQFQLPVMKSLKILSIVSSQRISFGTMNYAHHLPKLARLTLRGFDVFTSSNIFNQYDKLTSATSCVSLRTLSLPSKLDIPHFPKVLSQMFPNVTDLEVRGVTNEILREIWESWPKLETFKLVVSHFDDNIDSGLTGIPEETCAELRSKQNNLEDKLEEVKTSPAITDMHCLQSLEIECRAMWIPCQIITDITGDFALIHLYALSRLKVTEIGVPEKFDLSNECIRRILKALPRTEVTFKIMDDHGRWQQMDLGRTDVFRNTYESEPQLEDHNKDKKYVAIDTNYKF